MSFEGEPTHTVVFDPGVEIQTLEGREGSYDAIPVEENGHAVLLPVGSARLVRELKKLGSNRQTISITRKGSGFDTTYEVKVVKK